MAWESTAINDLIEVSTGRRLDPAPRDSEATLVVERMPFVPNPYMPAPPPAAHVVPEVGPPRPVIICAAAMATLFGVLIGAIVSMF
jgi:hypothetical protein